MQKMLFDEWDMICQYRVDCCKIRVGGCSLKIG